MNCNDKARPPIEPTLVAGVTDAVDIAGDDWTGFCVLRRDKTVSCWPVDGPAAPIAGISDAIDIAPPCALLADGTVSCWGEGVATRKPGLVDVAALSRGQGATCARFTNGSLSCWGQSATDYLDKPPGMSDNPTRIVTVKGALEIDVSSLRGACARVGANVRCWGGEFKAPVHSVVGVKNATQVSMGDYHGCALQADATVACWGENASGQLGVPSERLERSDDALQVPSVRGIVEIACGGGEPSGGSGSSCGITKTGEVLCWSGGGVGPLDLSVQLSD